MSLSTKGNMPSFGISKAGGVRPNEDTRSIQNYVETMLKVPILDLQHHAKTGQGQPGDVVLNQSDSLLYYHTGRQWIPLAVMDMEERQITHFLNTLINVDEHHNVIIEAPNSGNIRIVAGNNSPGTGGHVHVSAGQGGIADGEIYMDVGGECALTIRKTADVLINAGSLHVESGDVVVKSGNIELEDPVGCINCNIARAEVTAYSSRQHTVLNSDFEDSESENETSQVMLLPDATLNGMSGILTINLDLSKGKSIKGQVHNGLIQESSWVALTVSNDSSGVPHAWLNSPQDGSISYHIRCLDGELSRVNLYFDVRNSI